MKISRLVMFLFVASTAALIGCVPEPGDSDPTDTPTDSTIEGTEKTDSRPAALEEARPVAGDVIQGDFVMMAVVDTLVDVEVRFLLDGQEVGVVNEFPYELSMSACDLSVGNHAYVVEIQDANGNRDFAEQWFTTQDCD